MGGFHPKITASALAGALVTVIISEANRRGITIDGSEGASLAVILSFAAGYFVPSNGADAPDPLPVNPPVPVVVPPPPPPAPSIPVMPPGTANANAQ